MVVSKEDLDLKKYLKNCLDDIKQINELGKNLEIESKDLKETRKFIWENKGSMIQLK